MGDFTFNLSKEIIDSGKEFDRVVALAKGGWTWARTLADYLNIDHLSSVRIKSYTGVNEAGKPRIVQPLTDQIHNEKVLIFDEVVDSGETLKKALDYLSMMGADEIKTASLCYKPRSKIKPDFYAFKTDAWVIFPHEIREFIEISSSNWRGKGVSEKQIRKRLDKLGIPDQQVKYFLDQTK